MIFFFGWGHQKVKEHGPIFRKGCNNCGNTSFWHLFTTSVWFELFFFPVIPYQIDHLASCPICGNSIKLNELQFTYYSKIVELNLEYNNSEISKEEYKIQVDQLNEILK